MKFLTMWLLLLWKEYIDDRYMDKIEILYKLAGGANIKVKIDVNYVAAFITERIDRYMDESEI